MVGIPVKKKVRKGKPRRKKRVTVLKVKSLIRQGINYSTQLAKYLKVSKQYMGRFLKKMEENNEIEVDVSEGRGKVAIYYKVVEKRVIQKPLWEWCVGLPTGLPYFRDGIQISYGILNYDEYFKPQIDWKLGATLMKGITIDDCFIRIANDKTITFIFNKIYGKDPITPITEADFKAYKIKRKFLSMYPDFVLTPIPINMKEGRLGETITKEALKKYSGIKTKNAIIDKTPEEGTFEINIDKIDPLKTAENMKDAIDFMATGGIKLLTNELRTLNQVLSGYLTENMAMKNAFLLIAQNLKKLTEKK